MSRRAARFTQADLYRVFAAAKRSGMAAHVDLVAGTVSVIPKEDGPQIDREGRGEPVEVKRVSVL